MSVVIEKGITIIDPETGMEIELVKDPDTCEYVQFEWRDIEEYKGLYQVSNYGHVRSLDRFTISKSGVSREFKGKVMKLAPSGGYLTVSLYKNGTSTTYLVHRLVSKAFINNPKGLKYVNHKKPKRSDNRITNLEWCTQQENIFHAHSLNLSHKGEKTHTSKLKEEEVLEICELLDTTKMTNVDIGNKYGVSAGAISCINTGKSWNYLTGRRESRTVFDKNGKNNHASKSVVNCRGEVFSTIKEAARVYGISRSTLRDALNNRRDTAGKYKDGTKINWKLNL